MGRKQNKTDNVKANPQTVAMLNAAVAATDFNAYPSSAAAMVAVDKAMDDAQQTDNNAQDAVAAMAQDALDNADQAPDATVDATPQAPARVAYIVTDDNADLLDGMVAAGLLTQDDDGQYYRVPKTAKVAGTSTATVKPVLAKDNMGARVGTLRHRFNRAMRALDGPASMRDILGAMSHGSTMYNYANAMVAKGLFVKHADGTYSITPKATDAQLDA